MWKIKLIAKTLSVDVEIYSKYASTFSNTFLLFHILENSFKSNVIYTGKMEE